MKYPIFKYAILILLANLSTSVFIHAQIPNFPDLPTIDTANKDNIELLQSDTGTFIFEGNTSLNILQGNVVFAHKGDLFYCDSARINLANKQAWAYGNVKVQQSDGTVAFADRMYYNGHSKKVEMRNNVELNSGADYLWSDNVDYNLNTKIGNYWNGGTLQSGNTVVSSKSAQYNAKTHQARFKGDVNVLDPEYEVVSADLGYNTQSRLVTFYGPSIINNDSSSLFTTKGTYDAEKEIADFVNRSSIQNNGQYLEADKLHYDRNTGLGIGTGNVIIIDSTRNTTLYSEYATMNEKTKQMLATDNAYLKIDRDSNTMYIRGDTFFSEPVINLKPDGTPNAQDSILMALDILKRKAHTGELLDSNLVKTLDSLHNVQVNDSNSIQNNLPGSESEVDTLNNQQDFEIIKHSDSVMSQLEIQDTLIDTTSTTYTSGDFKTQDTTLPQFKDIPLLASNDYYTSPPDTSDYRYFNVYHHVLIYSDSVQAKADSMTYSQSDSLMVLYYEPVVWTRDGQVIGNIIFAKVDSNNIEWIKIPQNGIMINQSTNLNELMFDQIQGNTLWAYFSKNELDSITTVGNSQSIYYPTDDNGAYIGVSEASAMNIHIQFMADSISNKRKIKRIIYYKDFNQKLSPLKMVQPQQLRLSRFNWRTDERPKSLNDFFDYFPESDTPSDLIKHDVKSKLEMVDTE